MPGFFEIAFAAFAAKELFSEITKLSKVYSSFSFGFSSLRFFIFSVLSFSFSTELLSDECFSCNLVSSFCFVDSADLSVLIGSVVSLHSTDIVTFLPSTSEKASVNCFDNLFSNEVFARFESAKKYTVSSWISDKLIFGKIIPLSNSEIFGETFLITSSQTFLHSELSSIVSIIASL